MKKREKRPLGRPPSGKAPVPNYTIRLAPEMLQRIEKWRIDSGILKDSKAIRQLLDIALTSEENRRAKE